MSDDKLERANAAQKDSRDATYFFYEKLAFYTAGAIPLSITFVGYLVSKPGNLLSKDFLFLKLYELLMISWGLLFLSLVLSIGLRLWGADYAFRTAHKEWLEELKNSAQVNATQISQIDVIIKQHAWKIKFLEIISNNAGWISTTFFILGILFMFVFVIQSFLSFV